MKSQARWSRALLCASFASIAMAIAPAAAQDSNIFAPISDLEELFRFQPFAILTMTTSRGLPDERTYSPTVRFENGATLKLKFAPAPIGGEAFNNRPQYELAAYEIQKLFLDESEYVVPPTVARCLPFDFVEQAIDMAPNRNAIENPRPTFDGWRMSLVVLQYWLQNIDIARQEDIRNMERLEQDEAFARHVANFNLLTYLIRHNDSNIGNFLISTDPENPRVFAVDNGLAFSHEESNRGTYWRDLRVERFPAKSIERLRQITLEGLQATLGVVAQFSMGPDGNFVPVEPTENLATNSGIRRRTTVLQLGLRSSEIRDVHRRLERLLRDVDNGKYEVF
jgi:hypothetical protein